MTHTHLIGAALVGLQLAIGYGVFRVFRATRFVADVVSDSMASAGAEMSPQYLEDEEDGELRAPMGFHSARGG